MSKSTQGQVGEFAGDPLCEGVLEHLGELCPLFVPVLLLAVVIRAAVDRLWRGAGPAEEVVNEGPKTVR